MLNTRPNAHMYAYPKSAFLEASELKYDNIPPINNGWDILKVHTQTIYVHIYKIKLIVIFYNKTYKNISVLYLLYYLLFTCGYINKISIFFRESILFLLAIYQCFFKITIK